MLVGGSGEQRTLRLVARHADACNLFGDAATVRRKVEVLIRRDVRAHRADAEVGVGAEAPFDVEAVLDVRLIDPLEIDLLTFQRDEIERSGERSSPTS